MVCCMAVALVLHPVRVPSLPPSLTARAGSIQAVEAPFIVAAGYLAYFAIGLGVAIAVLGCIGIAASLKGNRKTDRRLAFAGLAISLAATACCVLVAMWAFPLHTTYYLGDGKWAGVFGNPGHDWIAAQRLACFAAVASVGALACAVARLLQPCLDRRTHAL
jgi:hypothetical protein